MGDPCEADGGVREILCDDEGEATRTQTCADGVWVNDTDYCIKIQIQECLDGDTRTEVCGLNSDGLVDETCVDGAWQESSACTATSVCVDGATQLTGTFCGLNSRGQLQEICVGGRWREAGCFDTDQCIDGEVFRQPDSCGLNGTGDIVRNCLAGQWTPVCEDTDMCTNGEQTVRPCGFAGSGIHTCQDGDWVATDCDESPLQISKNTVGSGATGSTFDLSSDGRQVVFSSRSIFDTSDLRQYSDIFLRDVSTADIERISRRYNAQARPDSFNPVMSGDGSKVAYITQSGILANTPNINGQQVVVLDVATGEHKRASTRLLISTGPGAAVEFRDPFWQSSFNVAISSDGDTVAFNSSETAGVVQQIFVSSAPNFDAVRISDGWDGTAGDSDSIRPSVSGDGNLIVFQSDAALVIEDTDIFSDIYIYDRVTETLSLLTPDGFNGASEHAVISDDGTTVVFSSTSTELDPNDTSADPSIYRYDLQTQSFQAIAPDSSNGREQKNPDLSADGSVIVYEGVRGIRTHAFAWNFNTGGAIRLGLCAAYKPRVSADGTYMVWRAECNHTGDDRNGVDDVYLNSVTSPNWPFF